jgi:Tfp pilus assembly protein PilV
MISNKSNRSFVLLEAMLGVTIFVVGVLAIGRSVNNCLNADAARRDDQRARMALQNCMAEVESGAVQLTSERTEKLKEMYSGITLKVKVAPVKKTNEKKQELPGLSEVQAEATWQSGTQPQSKVLTFYVLRPQ